MTPNEELYDLPQPHAHGESFVKVGDEVVATQMTLAGAIFTRRGYAKHDVKAEVWQGWRIGGDL